MSTTAGQVAEELRRIADSLSADPDAEIVRPMLSFYCNQKQEFLALAQILPRPLAKPHETNRYVLENKQGASASVWMRALIDRSKVCKLVTPAQDAIYECEPLLSEAEEAAITEEPCTTNS